MRFHEKQHHPLLISICLLLGLSKISAQTESLGFNISSEYAGWAPVSSHNPPSFSYDQSNEAVNYSVSSTEYEYLLSTQLLKKQLSYQLTDNFRVSFKVRKRLSSSYNSYFPLLLTSDFLSAPHQHPWRLGPYTTPTLGNQQSVALIGVVFTHNQLGFVHRQHQSTSGQISYVNGFNIPPNTDLWVQIEKRCGQGYRLRVFNVAEMNNTPLVDELYNYSEINVPLGALYISNCNGNGEYTAHDDLLDNYKVELLSGINVGFDYSLTPGTCDAPGQLTIQNISGGTPPYMISFNGSAPGNSAVYQILPEETSVEVEVFDNSGCSGTMNIDLSSIGQTGDVHFPNVLTQDGDGVNDEWFAQITCVRTFQCTILDRWGIPIKELNSVQEKWDGTFNGQNCSEGVYFYSSTIEFTSGVKEVYHGFIHLRR